MTSQRKIDSNRQNALRSTGPKSTEGKARVARNALSYGLTAKTVLVAGEDPEELKASAEAHRMYWNPQGPLEHFLVDKMTREAWRLGRVGRIEAGILRRGYYGILAKRASRKATKFEEKVDVCLEAGAKPRAADEEKHDRAAAEAKQMRALRKKKVATMGLVFTRASQGGDVFSKLSLYEVTIERSFFRALHELQRLQHARLGGRVPPPLALDVTVSGGDEDDPDNPIGALRARPA